MQNRLCAEALDAEEAGRLEEAIRHYRDAIACDDRNPTPYLFHGFALQMLDRHDAAVQAWSLAADLDPRVINAWRSENISPDVRQRSKAADVAVRRHFTALHDESIAAFRQRHPQAEVDRIANAVWCQTHDAPFEYRHPAQRPHIFYVPDLAPIPVYGPEHLTWQAVLEGSFEAIRDEFLSVRDKAGGEEIPYLEPRAAWLGKDWEPIADSLNWGSFQLYRKGVANESLLEKFPETLDTLRSIPVLETQGHPREITFSILQGGQRIPPHYGVSNTDVTAHLPIIGTEQSAIRVADHVHQWQEGRLFAFDDAFYHESWNDSPEMRVNLLFEAWHPDLTDDEREAIGATFHSREEWNASRTI